MCRYVEFLERGNDLLFGVAFIGRLLFHRDSRKLVENDAIVLRFTDRVSMVKTMKTTKRGRDNIAIMQSILDRNVSVDELARLMNEHKNSFVGVKYWQRRINKLIEIGELRA